MKRIAAESYTATNSPPHPVIFMTESSTIHSLHNLQWETGAKASSKKAAAMLEPTADLLAELALASEELETASPQQILRWAVDRFAPLFTMATAFGPEGMVILHMLAEIAPARLCSTSIRGINSKKRLSFASK